MRPDEDLPPSFQVWIESFELSLRAKGRSPKTRRTYTDAAAKLAWWLIDQDVADWASVSKRHLELYMAWFQEGGTRCGCGKPRSHPRTPCPKGRPYEKGYANNQYRALQQFWKWYAAEEETTSPLASMSPPSIDDKVVPVIASEDLARLVQDCEKGRDFSSRRDAALIRLYACSGARLAEVAVLEVDDLNLRNFELLVTGKAGKQRIIKFDAKCAQALDRYLRSRATHRAGRFTSRLWLGTKGPLTPSGVYQAIESRGKRIGLKIYPHQFRHTFTHRWLDAGGAEGDLMELNGWDSPQMLRRYGRSARSARARRAYDRVDVMGGI